MYLHRFPLDGDLNPINESHSGFFGDCACCSKATQIIVIGQRQHLNAIGKRPAGDVSRRQKAVGGRGVTMKIGVEHGGQRA
jgi:hypothetical protein